MRHETAKEQGQTLQAPDTDSSSLDMFRVATVVQKIVTELNVAVSEEETTVAITKIVIKRMNPSGH